MSTGYVAWRRRCRRAWLRVARLSPGADLVIEETGLEKFVEKADFVVTGEGRLDGQTAMGKAPAGVARIAKRHGKPVIAFSGVIGDGAEALNGAGIDAYFPILRRICTLDEALDPATARENLSATAEQAFRLLSAAAGDRYCT